MAQPSAYQRVTSEYDVTEAGKADKWHLVFNGINDFLETPSIDFTGTDEMSVFAGVRKLSDAAVGVLTELSTDWADNEGAFNVGAKGGGGSTTRFYSSPARGSASVTDNQVAEMINLGAAPDTAIITATHTISGDLSTIRRNGVPGQNGVGDKGVGNFGNYALYIGARAGTSALFNGHIYSLVVRGKLTEADTIDKTEKLVANKTGISI